MAPSMVHARSVGETGCCLHQQLHQRTLIAVNVSHGAQQPPKYGLHHASWTPAFVHSMQRRC
jgi:hypothetical protein